MQPNPAEQIVSRLLRRQFFFRYGIPVLFLLAMVVCLCLQGVFSVIALFVALIGFVWIYMANRSPYNFEKLSVKAIRSFRKAGLLTDAEDNWHLFKRFVLGAKLADKEACLIRCMLRSDDVFRRFAFTLYQEVSFELSWTSRPFPNNPFEAGELGALQQRLNTRYAFLISPDFSCFINVDGEELALHLRNGTCLIFPTFTEMVENTRKIDGFPDLRAGGNRLDRWTLYVIE